MISNEIPRLRDASGAIASRVILVPFTRSFYGKEDPDLTGKLLTELPGMHLNWSLDDSVERLRARGWFICSRGLRPGHPRDRRPRLADLRLPSDRCALGPEQSILVRALYAEWRNWCADQGRDHAGDAQSFGRDLRAAVPGVRIGRAGDESNCAVTGRGTHSEPG